MQPYPVVPVSDEPPLKVAAERPRANLLRQAGFRLSFVFLLIYTFPGPLFLIPQLNPLNDLYEWPWNHLISWVGPLLVHQPVALGGSDSLSEFLRAGLKAIGAIVITIIWMSRNRSAELDARLARWFRVYARYMLAGVMLGYGFSKVMKSQFPAVGPERVMEPLGHLSPMRLLWLFMGYSTPYTVFGGALEVLGSVLLFFRRTATLGALLLVSVMANVVMLNFAYDVSVKIFSSLLLSLAIFIASRDAGRIASVLVLERPTAAAPEPPLSTAQWYRRVHPIVKTLFIAYLVCMPAQRFWQNWHTFGDATPVGPFFGLYEVDRFERAGVAVPPSTDDKARWRRFAVTRTGGAVVQMMDDRMEPLGLTDFAAEHSLRLIRFEPTGEGRLTYRWTDPNVLDLTGTWENAPVHIVLRRVDYTQSNLLRARMHWVWSRPSDY